MVKLALVLLMISSAILAQKPKWRPTTTAELNAEIAKELKEMAKYGIIGDPSCSVGFAMGNREYFYDESPCALTDGHGHFRAQITVWIKSLGRTCKYLPSEVPDGEDQAIQKCKARV